MKDQKRNFSFSAEKNAHLKKERDISFEEIIAAIDNGQILDVLENPNKKKYSHQEIAVVLVNDYVYMVPFVEKEDGVFLKTIYPSRKMKKVYLSGDDENED